MQHHTRERLKRVDAHRVQEWRERKRRLAEEACGRGGLLREERIKAMFHLGTSSLTHLLVTYGYGAVLLFVAIESTGIPFPGETMLLLAAIASGTTHQLSIAMVIVAAASGAILGDNLGFWVGREGGYRRLAPLRSLYPLGGAPAQTRAVPVPEARGESGVLRALRGDAARLGRLSGRDQPHALAALSALQCRRGIVWASLYGVGGYFLGDNIHRLTGPIGPITLILAVLLMLAGIILARRHEQRLTDEAERALPGPLDAF